ncbi:30S ribosomal protein S2 [Candidatus Roizmanbacteria bacterium]|nr:30S ribosomal protein S2 [Candidatus Roizmanbacteria bacterium]
MQPIDLKVLLEAGAHFGHKTNKWHPSASKFIYKAVGDIHIIDLVKTKQFLEEARDFMYEQVSEGKEVLFVGTKRQASALIKQEAEAISAPYINNRWIGGFITNWPEVKKNIDKMNQLERDLKDTAKMAKYTKLERVLFDRERGKLESVYGGVRNLEKPPDILYVIDVRKEETAIAEARHNNMKVVGIVDTNTDTNLADYVIPANDDAVGSISYITKVISEAYREGKEVWKTKQEKEAKAQEAAKKAAEQKTLQKTEAKPSK